MVMEEEEIKSAEETLPETEIGDLEIIVLEEEIEDKVQQGKQGVHEEEVQLEDRGQLAEGTEA